MAARGFDRTSALGSLSIHEPRVRVKTRLGNISRSDRIHRDVIQIFSQIIVISDDMVEESRLPKMLSAKTFRLHSRPLPQLHNLWTQC